MNENEAITIISISAITAILLIITASILSETELTKACYEAAKVNPQITCNK